MKILHVPFSFPPDPPAGTEIYVAALCRDLRERGVTSVVAAPGPVDAAYQVDGVEVRRFAISGDRPTLRALYGGADPVAAAGFARLLDREQPSLLHQHALTFGCSIELLRAARRRSLPAVFTYHTPTTSCQRGTLLEFGTRVCDGRLAETRCAACTLHGLGVPRPLSAAIAGAPVPVSAWLGARLPGRVSTALQLPAAMRARMAMLQEFFGLPDRFVALTPWVRDLMIANGVSADRIALCKHGWSGPTRPAAPRRRGGLRIAHLGRLDPVKGTDLLIRAVREVAAPVELDIFGLVRDSDDATRLASLRETSAGDRRIRFLPPLEPATVVEVLADYDLVAVPSQWLETGPLVVLEAFAAGVPVMGSALGGLAEKVRDGVDGVLVTPHGSRDAWRAALQRLAADPERAQALKAGVRPPRQAEAVADEMRALYASLVAARGGECRAAV